MSDWLFVFFKEFATMDKTKSVESVGDKYRHTNGNGGSEGKMPAFTEEGQADNGER